MTISMEVSQADWRCSNAYAAHACLNQAVCSRDYGRKRIHDAHFARLLRREMRESALEAVAFARAAGIPRRVIWQAWRATYALRRACGRTLP